MSACEYVNPMPEYSLFKNMKKYIILLLAALTVMPADLLARKDKDSGLKVISYNIRMGSANDGTNSWQYRYPASAMMIDDQKPDIFGLQEALPDQFKYMDEILVDYKGVGVPRDDGKKNGEIMAIFWNKKTISMLKWGTFWLSETPDEPSLGWDAACKRTATWALMKDKKTGRKFFYVNTHLDHVGWEARKNGLALIVDYIGRMNPKGYPMVLTGDFNMDTTRPEFDDLKKIMKNTREVAFKTDRHNTYNGWGKDKESIIDHIFYSGFSSCAEYQTIDKPYNKRTFISDHYPVSAILIL